MTAENHDNQKMTAWKRIRRFFGKILSAIMQAPLVFVIIVALLLSGTLYLGITRVTKHESKITALGLRNIGELSTQAGYFTSVQLISGSRQVFGVDIPLTQSKFIFSYDGVIKAGVDFESVEFDVDENNYIITVQLPQAKIHSVEIDESSFEIFDETNNIFNPLGLKDVNTSLAELKDKAKEKAIANGLLENARSNAEMLIRGFLSGTFDAQKYTIVFK